MKYQIHTRVGFSAACVALLVAAPAISQDRESEIEDVEEAAEDVEEEVEDLDPAEQGSEFEEEMPEVETAPPEYQEQPLIEEEFSEDPEIDPQPLPPYPVEQDFAAEPDPMTQEESTWEEETTWGSESIYPGAESRAARRDMGISVTAGGGVTGFLDSETNDATSVGGTWGARVLVGSRSPIAGEIAYLGSLQQLDTLGLDGDAKLMSNGGEVAARFNILQGPIQPYLLAGVGYLRYQLTDEGTNTSNVEDSDNVAHFPLAVGGAYQTDGGFVLDLRGVARPVASDSMFEAAGGSMHSWGINLNAGAEF